MYNIGQYRKSQSTNYLIPLGNNWKPEQHSYSPKGMNIIFTDVKFDINGGIGSNDEQVVNENSYYLNFKVQRHLNDEQYFRLKLRHEDEDETKIREQYLEDYIVHKGNSDYAYFEIVFTPNASYETIIWELQRTTSDYTDNPRTMTVQILNFSQINNIIPQLSLPANTKLTKIGIQGPPSMLMCINGEQIRNSRSGIYEINNDKIKIKSIGFVPKGNDYFIMDYEY